jgi:hypothetical protein
MIPTHHAFDETLLSIRYVSVQKPNQSSYLGLPKWKDGVLRGPSIEQFHAWWKKIKASHDTGALELPDGTPILRVELLQGGYFNTRPEVNGRGETVMKILATQVCNARVIAHYPLTFGEQHVNFEWMHEPKPAPETITSELPTIPE